MYLQDSPSMSWYNCILYIVKGQSVMQVGDLLFLDKSPSENPFCKGSIANHQL